MMVPGDWSSQWEAIDILPDTAKGVKVVLADFPPVIKTDPQFEAGRCGFDKGVQVDPAGPEKIQDGGHGGFADAHAGNIRRFDHGDLDTAALKRRR